MGKTYGRYQCSKCGTKYLQPIAHDIESSALQLISKRPDIWHKCDAHTMGIAKLTGTIRIERR